MTIPRVVHSYDVNYGDCACPSCILAVHMNNVVYGTQKIASPEVMAELPSPMYRAPTAAGVLTPPPSVPPPPYDASHAISAPPPSSADAEENETTAEAIAPPPPLAPSFGFARRPPLTSCPMYDTYGWCLYGSTCLLAHGPLPEGSPYPLVAPATSVESAFADLLAMGRQHMSEDVWTCEVCGYYGILSSHMAKVGETYSYRYCIECTTACYLPRVLNLVEALITAVGDDYQLYKNAVEQYRRMVPELLKIPLSYEAHRIATTVFAWSLFSPQDAKLALETVSKVLGEDFNIVASVGCGTGYVEHVFNRVANGAPATPCGPTLRSIEDGSTILQSSFFGVRAALGPRPISFFAFDEIIRPVRYSVAVSTGAPNVLSSLDCPRAALLLCWPPFGSPEEEQSSMGFEALRYFYNRGGRVVIYVGDVSSTGDWRFHSLLMRMFYLSPDYYVRHEVRRWLPQEMGLVYAGCDSVGVYVRRPDGPLYC